MKTTHAVNFFLIGRVMCFGPAYWPEYFSGTTAHGNSSEVWSLLMGVLQMALGGWAIGLNEVPRLLRFLAEWEPVTLTFAPADVGWALPESFYAGLNQADEVTAG
jgi:hypothetical protein